MFKPRANPIIDHLRHLHRRNLRPSTIYQRRRALVRLSEHVRPRDLLDLGVNDLLDHLDAMAVEPESKATEISHLRGFYRWAVDEGRIDTDPSNRLVRPRLPQRLPRPMPDADMQRAIREAPATLRAAMMLAAYAGLRACEIAQLRGEDVTLTSSPPILVVRETKGGGMTAIPIAPALASILATMPATGWLFPRCDGLPGHWKPHSVSARVNGYLHELGITHTLHTLRHWFGTHLYRASGRDLRATQEGMRHRSIASTVLYTFVDPGSIVDAVNLLPPPTQGEPAA